MSNLFEEIRETVEETFQEEELIAQSEHPKLEHGVLYIRNGAVLIAMVLFAIAILPILLPYTSILMAVGYFFGAAAYVAEILMLTDFFRVKVPNSEMFMAVCFGPMYILMGINYILH